MSPIDPMPQLAPIPDFQLGSAYSPQQRLNNLHSLLTRFQAAIKERDSRHVTSLKGKIEAELGKTNDYCTIRNAENKEIFSFAWTELSLVYSQTEALRTYQNISIEELSSDDEDLPPGAYISGPSEIPCESLAESQESSGELSGYDKAIGPLSPLKMDTVGHREFKLPNEAEFRKEVREKFSKVKKDQGDAFREAILLDYKDEVARNPEDKHILKAKKNIALQELRTIVRQKSSRSALRLLNGCNPENFEKVGQFREAFRLLLERLQIPTELFRSVSFNEAYVEISELLEEDQMLGKQLNQSSPSLKKDIIKAYENEIAQYIYDKMGESQSYSSLELSDGYESARSSSPIDSPLVQSFSSPMMQRRNNDDN